MIDYKEQILIIGIKANMQYLICHVLPKIREIVRELWDLQTHESTWEQFTRQINNLAL